MSSTEHAVSKYLPESRPQRSGVALCLSGGGYRAALFHLGALRRLNELGVLSKLTTISSVSGGSILAAHLADRIDKWPDEGESIEDFEERVVVSFERFVKHNIRTAPIVKRLVPWNWFRPSTAVEALASRYERDLTSLRLAELPERPRFIFCATDMSYGVNWTFTRDKVGDYQVGYAAVPSDWPLARAVAASSCFPPVFDPLPAGFPPAAFSGGKARPGPQRDDAIRTLGLSDGGVYDNMGLEPVWKDHEVVLVSDGGATFDFGADRGLFWRLQRYNEIISRQASGMRKRWLISSFIRGEMEGTYWGLGSAATSYGASDGYSEEVVDGIISEVRTDLDVFSDAEIAVLQNHGYLLADAALRRHAPQLVEGAAPGPRAPHPQWMNEDAVRSGLADSHKLRLPFGRR